MNAIDDESSSSEPDSVKRKTNIKEKEKQEAKVVDGRKP